MIESPVYVVAPPGSQRDHISARLSNSQVTIVDSIEDLGPLSARTPGVVVLATDAAGGADGRFLQLVAAMSGASPDWRLLAASGPALEFRSIVIGSAPASDVSLTKPHTTSDDLERHLAEVDRARHDLNNVLMSTLAEIQMLLLDDATPEVTESHRFVEAQLRAMRDLIATMGTRRP